MSTENKSINDQLSGKLVDVAEEDITSTETRFYALDPNLPMMIQITKGVNVTLVSLTISGKADIELADFIERSSGTDDYFVGDSTGITGVKVAVTFTSGAVAVLIKQAKLLN